MNRARRRLNLYFISVCFRSQRRLLTALAGAGTQAEAGRFGEHSAQTFLLFLWLLPTPKISFSVTFLRHLKKKGLS